MRRNFLGDGFAQQLRTVLRSNNVIHTIDIGDNPITKDGGRIVLKTLLEENETLCSLGNLDENMLMGVRVREEIRQCLRVNRASKDVQRAMILGQRENVRKTLNAGVEKELQDAASESGPRSKKEVEYPLLKPIAFTNTEEDDFNLEMGVWNLRN